MAGFNVITEGHGVRRPARGRVHYDTIVERWTILADKHILADDYVMLKVRERLSLPDDCATGLDLHYRCPRCLYGEDQGDEDED